jgi:hypothetical protein
VPGTFLKEVTTRQAHQDGQRLLDAFTWGRSLAGTSEEERRALLSELIDKLKNEALVWLRRQNLKLQLERRDGPTKWINVILESARGRSGGIVEQHLVGAKLERRFKTITIPNHPAHAGDRQTEREGDFRISNSVFHVTATPTRDVLRKCASNASAGMHPVLLVPAGEVNRAKLLAEVEGVAASATVISIEDFLTMNIIELAAEESSDFFTILKEILVIYNRRLVEVETDLSLQVEIR